MQIGWNVKAYFLRKIKQNISICRLLKYVTQQAKFVPLNMLSVIIASFYVHTMDNRRSDRPVDLSWRYFSPILLLE